MKEFALGVAASLVAALILWALPPTRHWIARAWRWVWTLRLTTTNQIDLKLAREIHRRRQRVVQPRWLLSATPGSVTEALLANNGGAAYAVRVDSEWDYLQVVSKGHWDSVGDGERVTFTVHWRPDPIMGSDHPEIQVAWVDAAGDEHCRDVQIIPRKARS